MTSGRPDAPPPPRGGEAAIVTTKVPARLDRLPRSGRHWMIVIGLGAVWILDGLEVTVVGNIASRLSGPGSGLPITDAQVTGMAAALYVTGDAPGRWSSADSPTGTAVRNSSSSRSASTSPPRR